MYLHRTPYWLSALYPSFTWHKSRKEKTLFLTFDDGPIPGVTEFVLEQLAHHKALATFFCVGDNIAKHPDVFSKVIAQGHSIGNHTHNHLNGWKEEDGSYYENILLCQKAIEKHAVFSDRNRDLIRPPYGKIKRSQARLIKDKFEVVMWDVLSGDFDSNLHPEVCLKKTIGATKNGSIIIFHDSIKSEKNLSYVLPRFLSHFIEKGYVFQSL